MKMYRKFLTAVFGFHYVVQAIFTLLTPMALMALLAWFLTAKLHVGSWIWAVLLILGTFAGLISMIRYLVAVSKAEEQREKELETDEKR